MFWVVVIVTAAFSAVNERELRRRRYDLEALANFSLRLESVSKGSDVAEILARDGRRGVRVRAGRDVRRP